MTWNAHVWVKWSNDYRETDWEWLNQVSKVKRAWSTMGDWDCCLEVEVSDPDELESFVWNELKNRPWIWRTHSTWSKQVWSNGA